MSETKIEWVVQRIVDSAAKDLEAYDDPAIAKKHMDSVAEYFTDRKYRIVKRTTTEEVIR